VEVVAHSDITISVSNSHTIINGVVSLGAILQSHTAIQLAENVIVDRASRRGISANFNALREVVVVEAKIQVKVQTVNVERILLGRRGSLQELAVVEIFLQINFSVAYATLATNNVGGNIVSL
jgi:hypothetical protein